MGSGNGQFKYPGGIAVDAEGNVFVNDVLNHRVQKFTSDGTFLATWYPSSLVSAEGIAVNTAGTVYLVDLSGHCILFTRPVVDPVPVANPDSDTTAEETQLTVPTADGVLANDAYVPGGTVQVTAGPTHGSLSIGTTGAFTYDPDANFYGTDSFAYTVTVGTQTSAAATVTITVTDVNDPPTAAFTFLPAAPVTGDTVTFTDGSSDTDGTVSICSWTFGDSGSATGGNPTHAFAAAGTYVVILTATDDDGATATVTHSVTVTQDNQAPVVDAGTDASATEGAAVAFSGKYTDAGDTGVHTIAWTFGDGGAASGTLTPSHTYADNDAYTATLTVTDEAGESAADTIVVTVANAAPVVTGVTVPATPVAIGTSVTATATFTDAGTADAHMARWTWDDNSAPTVGVVTGSTVSGTHAYTSAGVYEVTMTVTDDDGGAGTGTAQAFVVAYDPNGGFVTGGGWITSPVWRLPNRSGDGRQGELRLRLEVPERRDRADGRDAVRIQGRRPRRSTRPSYDWLVIAGAKAQYKGTGTINGAGDYGFMLTAVDGDAKAKGNPDLFRLKIWDKTTGAIVFDNKMNAPDTDDPTTVLGGGSIVVHKK